MYDARRVIVCRSWRPATFHFSSVMSCLFDSVQIRILLTLETINRMCLKTCRGKADRRTEKAISVYPVPLFIGKPIQPHWIVVSMALLSDIHYWNSNSMSINERVTQKASKVERKTVLKGFIKTTTHTQSFACMCSRTHRMNPEGIPNYRQMYSLI